ncbi:Abhydrolase domain-containing protein 11 [Wickerhamomyces ciferrii]|uniref:Ethanol acetyltransferase 1 n=1 Tax=Wickerhamomyces ciferrii (strain ATCC 14091 / BCRC 22168 / CBS 111 / JCM 3599 / NBRC 0793 / NRRL Y-1031 F-60-10) TaxID=1206466 RepID=EAT1_WICCF|nr:Abhydrolase domain-containing protein 11 [Wickerhamomyces ciferrii]K0KPV8.1 RecName: Full=Ethanol acetyltransferase 1; AltName: Full=Acetyl-CoA hydrolase; AltName: Full=Acetyl-CoA thioesterase; AltName: Full=Alcohol acetyltransferase; Short=AAT; AltName: Full=Ethyl acetate esterase; Flags: Precursor [Wickerhamomyces ciferrii NRRL Y-1031]CCH45056.1 Abhydrolase domain-containing protein 11 [Wickerhamomyces ciferrii]
MHFTRTLFNQVASKASRQLPVQKRVQMAYDLHIPNKTVNPNLNIRSHEPIVFVHGIFGSKKNYRFDCQKIANVTHTPVYTVDLRNHGQSIHALPFDYETLAQDVADFCEDHGLKKVNLIGYSLGAKICMLTMLQNPDLIRSGVIIDNSPIEQPHIEIFLQMFVKSMIHVLNSTKIEANDSDWKRKADDAMKRYIPDGGIRKYLLANLINKVPKGYKSPVIDYDDGFIHFQNPVKHMTEVAVKNVSAWPTEKVAGKTFEGPIRFIKGTKSAFIDDAGKKAIAGYFPNHSISEINATHFILNERPLEYVRVICDFIKTERFRSLQEHLRNVEHFSPSEIEAKQAAKHAQQIEELRKVTSTSESSIPHSTQSSEQAFTENIDLARQEREHQKSVSA